MSDSPFIAEANNENFMALVIEKSKEVPVFVDFWADWCQPCKTLMPVLAKLADEYQGAFTLVKVNTDQFQDLAAQFGIRSLPTVKVFKGGEMVDEFMGVQPEPVIREMIDKHRVHHGESQRQQAGQLAAQGDLEGAESLLLDVVKQEPEYGIAIIELAAYQIELGKMEEAEATLAKVPVELQDEALVKALKAKLAVNQSIGEDSGDIDELEQQLAESPDDLSVILALANAKIARQDYDEALLLLLAIQKKDKDFQEGVARTQMLSIFEILGGADPLVQEYRRKMFSLLH